MPGSVKQTALLFLTLFKLCRQHTNQINFLQQERRTNFYLQGKMVLFHCQLETSEYLFTAVEI